MSTTTMRCWNAMLNLHCRIYNVDARISKRYEEVVHMELESSNLENV